MSGRQKAQGPLDERALCAVLRVQTRKVQAGWMLEACLPLGPVVTSKLTR